MNQRMYAPEVIDEDGRRFWHLDDKTYNIVKVIFSEDIRDSKFWPDCINTDNCFHNVCGHKINISNVEGFEYMYKFRTDLTKFILIMEF